MNFDSSFDLADNSLNFNDPAQQELYLFSNWYSDKDEELPHTDHRDQGEEEQKGEQEELEEDPIELIQDLQPKRSVKQIQISLNVLIGAHRARQGRSQEGKNIQKIFKSETMNYLRILHDFKILPQAEWTHLEDFKLKNWSLTSYQHLFSKLSVRNQLLAYLSSPNFARRILEQNKIDIGRKLEVLRHIEVFIKLVRGENVTSWTV